MKILNETSLARTVEAWTDAEISGAAIPQAERKRVARWIAGRRGLPGAYAGMFAPTDEDMSGPVVLFSGEKVTTNAARRHILGEEAGRLLLRTGITTRTVADAIEAANAGIEPRLDAHVAQGLPAGLFCCATCSVSLWRNLSAGGIPAKSDWLELGMRRLRKERDGKRGWGRYPFHYTVLALVGAEVPAARAELAYAAPRLERILTRNSGKSPFAERRRKVAETALARV